MTRISMASLHLNSALPVIFILFTGFLTNLSLGQGLFGGACPEPQCQCGLDQKGRMEVSCTVGRMVEIPTNRINPATEVIRIIPPRNQPNHLTVGRLFEKFKKLEELYILNSNIPFLGQHSFWSTRSLRILDFSRNNLTSINNKNFEGLVSLETLILAENNIESITSAAFMVLKNLRKLDLSSNRITKLVERLFFNLHQLEILDLSGNYIRELKADVFRDVVKLKELKCRRCGIRSISPMLYKILPELRVLDMGDNEFSRLNNDEFGGLLYLEELHLDGMAITALTENTFHSINLTTLSLKGNKISKFDKRTFYNSSIFHLDLSGNDFDFLDRSVIKSFKTRPTEIDLSRNPRHSFSSLLLLLSELPEVRWLNLAENNYYDLPIELFDMTNHLEYLNISGNYLRDMFPHQFKNLRNVRVLDLSSNRLRGLEADVLTQIDKLHFLREIYLFGNPWNCDLCYIPAFLKWLKVNPIFNRGCSDPNGKYCLRCSTPPLLYEKSVVTLEQGMLEWCDRSGEASSSILADESRFGLFIVCALIILILIVAAIAIIFHTRFHAAHYYTHEESRPEIPTPPVPPEYEDVENLYFGPAITGGSLKKKKMIATIEEMSHFRDIDDQYPHDNGNHLSSSPKMQLIKNCHR